ncbi:unnamed protein product, partial [Cyprideis torosa]
MGKSGSGKSTLLYILSTMDTDYTGELIIVLENVMLPARKLARKPFAQIKKDAMYQLDLLGIADQAKKKANMISGGQKQRVAIARALI